MKVEVQAAFARQTENPLQVGVEGGRCVGHDAEHAARLRHQVGQFRCERFDHFLKRDQTNRLQVYFAGPPLAHVAEYSAR